MSKKYVFEFGGGKADGKAEMKELLAVRGLIWRKWPISAYLFLPVLQLRPKFAIFIISIINLIRLSLKLK